MAPDPALLLDTVETLGTLDTVVLVDRDDRPVGLREKHAAHRPPAPLHRAVSAWLVDERGRVLLQRRSLTKYHFAGRWANACCTHPRPGEPSQAALARRIKEELGIDAGPLEPAGTFIYRAADAVSGHWEHELDHVFVGVVGVAPAPDPDEVAETAFVTILELRVCLASPDRAEEFVPWLEPILRLVEGEDQRR